MYEAKFSQWVHWEDREQLNCIDSPGVYVIRLSSKKIRNRKFSWDKEIIYVGMTNAITGLKGRLKAFDNTINGSNGHGGAHRVRFKHNSYKKLVLNLYVAVAYFNVNVKSNEPKDLRTMGKVLRFEYQCFAEYASKHGELPEFNDKERSPKK